MKTLVLILVAVLSFCGVCSGNHNKHNQKRTNEESVTAANDDWPTPGTINDFTVPGEFTSGFGDADGNGPSPGNGNEIPASRQHGKHHHRSHKN